MRGGEKLSGGVRVSAAKNAVLPLLAASILPRGDVTLRGCPDIRDVRAMGDILKSLGCRVERAGEDILVNADSLDRYELPDGLSKQIRSSIFLLGPVLAKMRRATVTYPGGCEIGIRPIDLHLSGLRMLGVRIEEEGGKLLCDGGDMRAGDVYFDYPSVGATENVMMAAVMLPGTTTIHNAAREPEIIDLMHCVNAMGGRVRGAGTHVIEITGVGELHGAAYAPIPDRIIAGTLLCAAAITGGEIELTNIRQDDLVPVVSKLREMGCRAAYRADRLTLVSPGRLRAFSQIITQPHPGFPTDMQAQMLAVATLAHGTSVITENVFENRFSHVVDLSRMGASILVSGRTAVVHGVPALHGARVAARDLRGGAALVIAGLAARGETFIENADIIDRGYHAFEHTLKSLGADIVREADAAEEEECRKTE